MASSLGTVIPQVLEKLIQGATSIEGSEPKFAEARRDAVKAITR